jgi:2-phosphoglycerate kinase
LPLPIHDASDNRLPFSRGIMATSLLATGVPTEDAYRLTSIIQQRLVSARQIDVTVEELVAAVHSILVDDADEPALANRWTSWQRAKRSGRPVVIVLCGAPGTGKSTLATRIAVGLDITRVVTSDAIGVRSPMQRCWLRRGRHCRSAR